MTWINDNAQEHQIELVPVLGDVGWGEGLTTAKDLLETLTVPYLPIIGDNEIVYGDEANFASVFAPQMEWLADNTTDWSYGGQSVGIEKNRKIPTLPTLLLPTKG